MPIPHSAARIRRRLVEGRTSGTLIRKTSLQDRTDDSLRSSNRADKAFTRRSPCGGQHDHAGSAYRKGLRPLPYSERSSLHDVRYHASRRSTHDCSRVHSAMKSEFVFSSDEISRDPHISPPWLKLRRAIFAVRRLACQPGGLGREGWWSQTGSNRRPPACKAGALPAELWPRKSISPALQKVGGPGKI
jgi:hypothetical protein